MDVSAPPLAIDRQAPVQRHQLDDTSWVDVVPAFVRRPDDEFRTVRDSTAWQQTEVLRYEKYVPEKRLGAMVNADAHPFLRQAQLHLESKFRVRWAGVATLLYRDGEDFQGFHGDREMRWLDDTLIAIVVLGVRRPFALRARGDGPARRDGIPAGDKEGDVVLLPGEGDLLVMGGACQRDWLHCVPRAETPDERISLTWRWTSKRGRPDTNPGYSEGRQFSDRPRMPGSRSRRV